MAATFLLHPFVANSDMLFKGFSLNWPLGRFSLVVAMFVSAYVCMYVFKFKKKKYEVKSV